MDDAEHSIVSHFLHFFVFVAFYDCLCQIQKEGSRISMKTVVNCVKLGSWGALNYLGLWG